MVTSRSLNIVPTPPPSLTIARQELVRTLLGDSLQPGVYGLLAHAGKVLDLRATDQALFLAVDPTAGALTLVREFGCTVQAVALAAEVVERGQHRIAEAGEEQRIALEYGQTEQISRFAGGFDVVITEGALAASSDTFAAASALDSALRSHGRIALTEPTVYHDLIPEELRPLFRWLTPLAGARPAPVYRSLLGELGLTAFVTEDRRQDLRRAVEAARQKLLLANLAGGAGDNDDLEASVRLARQVLDLISQGVASYVLISAEKP